MGNLAVKCETHRQERRIVASCVGGRLEVRVMKADGSGVQEFDRPVVAAEVMYQFPDYVVVQWYPKINAKLGKRGQLRVLRRYELLNPGQTYFLFPIPSEVAKNTLATTARRSRRMQFAKDRLSMLLQRSAMATAADASVQSLGNENTSDDEKSDGKDTQTLFPGFTVEGSKLGLQNSSAKSDEEKVGSTGEDEKTSGKPDLYLSPYFSSSSWRPALVSIPESPIGFHSRPESPLTPVAFRIVSFREQPGQ